MILEISAELDELLKKIQETTDSLAELEAPAKLVVLGVVLSRTIKNLDEEVDESEMLNLLMQKSEQILAALEELQIEEVNPSPGGMSN